MSQFLAAFLLGLAFCAPPGVVNIESLRRGLERGARAAFGVQLGSLLGDLFWAVLALLGVGFVSQVRFMRFVLGAGGVALLFALAWQSLRSAHTSLSADLPPLRRRDLVAGIGLSLTNPWGPAFWAGAGANLAARGQLERDEALLFLGGFFLGALAWAALYSGLIAGGRRFLRGSALRWASMASGLILIAFAIRLLASLPAFPS